MIEDKIVEKFDEIVNLTNVIGLDKDLAKNCALKIYNNHRTLQQSFWSIISQTISEYNKLCKTYGHDLRNERAAEFAEKVSAITDDFYFPLI